MNPVPRPGMADKRRAFARLQAYANAGADCMYAHGLSRREDIAAVVAAVAPRPVNVLLLSPSELSLPQIAELGVRRVSVGGALARCAWGGFLQAAQALADPATFSGYAGAASGKTLNAMFLSSGSGSRS